MSIVREHYDQGRLMAKQMVPEFNLSLVIFISFKSLTPLSTLVLPISIHSKDTAL